MCFEKYFSKLLPLQCEECGATYHRKKLYILSYLNPNIPNNSSTCSHECRVHRRNRLNGSLPVNVTCLSCGVQFLKWKSQIKQTPNNFCSQSCSATYNNKNKKFGNRRSKLEQYLELKLKERYPNLDIHFNRKDTINSELDIYIPSISLAFELNGIFHYEPIFGIEKLSSIQNNDERKFQACLERGIELCLIDTSKQTYVTDKTSDVFFTIITSLIDLKLKCVGQNSNLQV